MNGPIGKQMVDTLVESQANVEVGIGPCIHRLMIHRLMIHKPMIHRLNYDKCT